MFRQNNIDCFMGGSFTLTPEIQTAPGLAADLQLMADEVKSWGDVEISEAEIIKGEIVVTLKDGIF